MLLGHDQGQVALVRQDNHALKVYKQRYPAQWQKRVQQFGHQDNLGWWFLYQRQIKPLFLS